jgi:hypothetical protein
LPRWIDGLIGMEPEAAVDRENRTVATVRLRLEELKAEPCRPLSIGYQLAGNPIGMLLAKAFPAAREPSNACQIRSAEVRNESAILRARLDGTS